MFLLACGSKPPPAACNFTSSRVGTDNCQATFDCPDGKFEVRCTAADGGYACACVENHVSQKTFASPDACAAIGDEEQMKTVAQTGCGWTIR